MIRLALLVILLAAAHLYILAVVAALPLAFVVGHRHAIRKTGVGMTRAGRRRVRTGRLV